MHLSITCLHCTVGLTILILAIGCHGYTYKTSPDVPTYDFSQYNDPKVPAEVRAFMLKTLRELASVSRSMGQPLNLPYYNEDLDLKESLSFSQQSGNQHIIPNARIKRQVDNAANDANKQADGAAAAPAAAGADGKPEDGKPADGESKGKGESVWESHKWFFIIVFIFVGISIFLLAICLSCTLCNCRNRNTPHEPIKSLEDQPLEPSQLTPSYKSPLNDQEEPLLTVSVTSPAMAQAPPVRSEAPPSSPLDEENGWIIPMDQLTQEELQQTEVPQTRF